MAGAGKYTKLLKRFWVDPDVRELGDEEKLAAIYMLNRQANRIGLFAFSIGMAAEDLGWDLERTTRVTARVCQCLGWMYDATARVLYIPSWWKTNSPENQSHFKGCLGDLDQVPPTPLV